MPASKRSSGRSKSSNGNKSKGEGRSAVSRAKDPRQMSSQQLEGREPAHEPDVFVDIRKVKVDEIYVDVEQLEAHLALRAKLANLLQVVAGVHVHLGKVEVDVSGVEAEALLKVRLENLYDILDRALTTLDRNPEILESLVKTVDDTVACMGASGLAACSLSSGAISQFAGGLTDAAGQALWTRWRGRPARQQRRSGNRRARGRARAAAGQAARRIGAGGRRRRPSRAAGRSASRTSGRAGGRRRRPSRAAGRSESPQTQAGDATQAIGQAADGAAGQGADSGGGGGGQTASGAKRSSRQTKRGSKRGSARASGKKTASSRSNLKGDQALLRNTQPREEGHVLTAPDFEISTRIRAKRLVSHVSPGSAHPDGGGDARPRRTTPRRAGKSGTGRALRRRGHQQADRRRDA